MEIYINLERQLIFKSGNTLLLEFVKINNPPFCLSIPFKTTTLLSSFSLILESNWVLQNVCRMSFKTFNRQSDSLIIEKKDITDTESVGKPQS